MNLPTQVRLESLFLREDELQTARKHVQEIAYAKWQAAGCPKDGALKFWREAELEWIEYYYAAVHAEIGNLTIAENEGAELLRRLRVDTPRRENDIATLAREGWTMMLLLAIERHKKWAEDKDYASDSRGRWEQLRQHQCNPRDEVEAFDAILNRPIPARKPPEMKSTRFHPGEYSVTHHFGHDVFKELEPAYELIRFSEDAPYPPRVGDVRLCFDKLKTAANWFIPYDAVRTQSLVCRLMDSKLTNEYFSRHRIAALPDEQVLLCHQLARKTLRDAAEIPGVSDAQPSTPVIRRAQNRLATSIELIARTAIRLSRDELAQLWNVALDLYSSPMAFRGQALVNPMHNLFKSLFDAMPQSELQNRFQDVVTLPIPGSRDFQVWNQTSWPHLLSDFRRRISELTRTQRDEDWSSITTELLTLAESDDRRVRNRALLRLHTLFDYRCLRPEAVEKLAAVYWNDCGGDGLPVADVFEKYACLILPEPESGISIERFRNYALSEPLRTLQAGVAKPNSLLSDWLGATAPLRGSFSATRRFIDWSLEDVGHMVHEIKTWWNESGKSQFVDAKTRTGLRHFGDRPLSTRLSYILDVLRDIVIPRISSDTTVAADVRNLVADFKLHRVPVVAVLPALQVIDDASDATLDLRSALASPDENTYVSALQGLIYWLKCQGTSKASQGVFLLPDVPVDLVRELGIIVANRRQPNLIEALQTVLFILREFSHELDSHFKQSILVALEYLYGETTYQLSDTGEGRIPYEDVPQYRQIAAEIAAQLKRALDAAPEIVEMWINAAENDPLPEVRYAVHRSRQANAHTTAVEPISLNEITERLAGLVRKSVSDEEIARVFRLLGWSELAQFEQKAEVYREIAPFAANVAKVMLKSKKQQLLDLCAFLLNVSPTASSKTKVEFYEIAARDDPDDPEETYSWMQSFFDRANLAEAEADERYTQQNTG